MAFSYEDFPGDGVTTDFAVNKPYINKAHITLLENNVSVPFTWVNDSLVRADTAPVAGTTVRVNRTTPIGASLVDYFNGSTLDESDLDLVTLQLLYLAQETLDNSSNLTIEAAQTAAAESTTSATASAASATASAASAAAASASETAASASETASAASATAAAGSAAQLTGTSATSLAIAPGAKVFATQTGKFFAVSSWVLITSDADPSNYMFGQVTSYGGGSLTVNVTSIGGGGTFADWTIRVSGAEGESGADLAGVTTVSAARAFTLADAGKYLRVSSVTPVGMTVPTNAVEPFAIGAQIIMNQQGAGQITVVAAGGVTINTPESLNSRKQRSTITLVKVAIDEWDFMGDMEVL